MLLVIKVCKQTSIDSEKTSNKEKTFLQKEHKFFQTKTSTGKIGDDFLIMFVVVYS